ncbi:MAG: purine-binding chemotaxis protein CheW [Clostridiales bacterium]|nr:purine-binding chemotaxis protein CheW [Clostridiales bacterium]
MDSSVVLERGTEELELLVFQIDKKNYGINVDKIREIIRNEEVTMIPNSHPYIEGVFIPRDVIITLINLAKVLNLTQSADISKDMLIITNFNKLNIAFRVHSLAGIHRILQSDIMIPDKTINNEYSSLATGIVKMNEDLIIILDYGKIISDISSELV